ncbi:MAG: TIGR03545 family protein [Balneolales bacterium]|nr:TIGR03545 family protein [Balneolales bacterium]
MRVKGLIFVVIIAALAVGASLFVTDELVEEQIEKQLSIANGALVEIDDLAFNPTNLHLSWSRLQVTNPGNTMQNTFETGEAEFDVQFWPLLWEKVIVDDLKLNGFALQTERETDGYFEMPEDEEREEQKSNEPGFFADVTSSVSSTIAENANMQFTDVKDDINIDSLMAMVNLQSLDKMDSLKTGLETTYSEWDSTITNNSIITNTNDIKELVNGLKLEEIDDVPKALAAIETIKKVTAEADSLKNEVIHIKDNFQADLNASRNGLASIDGWIRDDINSAANVAKLPEINAQSIGTALFGESLLADLNTYLGYIATAREYGARLLPEKEDEEKIERYEGRNYEFTDKYDLPGLWIKSIDLSGVTNNDIALAGLVTNVSNDQAKTGEPTRFNLGGEDENAVSLTMDGELNYLGEEKFERVKVTYEGFSLAKSKISPSELLPYELSRGTGELSFALDVIDRRIDSEVSYLASDIEFDFASAGRPRNTVESLIRNAISSTDRIDASALIDNTQGPLRVRVRSNVDDLFLNTLKSTVQAEVDAAKKQIEDEVQSRINEKRVEVESFVDEQEQRLRAEYDRFEAIINDELQIVQKKYDELEAKKKELEESLKKDALDAVRKRIGF